MTSLSAAGIWKQGWLRRDSGMRLAAAVLALG